MTLYAFGGFVCCINVLIAVVVIHKCSTSVRCRWYSDIRPRGTRIKSLVETNLGRVTQALIGP